MPRIEEQYLIATVGLNPERINFIRWFYSQFDYRTTAGINRRIVNVEPLFYEGAIAGTEFLVYAATKLYLTLDFCIVYSAGQAATTVGLNCIFYNEANAICLYIFNNCPVWDTTAAVLKYTNNPNNIKNLYFSRFSSTMNYIKFNGYRITLD
jgi:hypothetical protein